MKRNVAVWISACLLLVMAYPLAAQQPTQPGGPPPLLLIIREQVKVGHAAGHEQVEAAWAAAFARAKWPFGWLAATSITGPGEAWFFVPYDSFASFEKDRTDLEKTPALKAESERFARQDAEVVSESRSVLARFREDLSYRSDFNIGTMRYFSAQTVRMRPGRNNDFTETRKMVRGALEKTKADIHQVVFQAVSGAPAGTFFVFRPMKSLKAMDETARIFGKQFQEAMGEEGRKRMQELSAAGGQMFSETALFALSPKMSYVAAEIAAADPAFWKPKAAQPAARKTGEKPAAKQ